MPFTVVVVLHDSATELTALLRSLDAHLSARPQLVVVDTGSDDGGAASAAAWGAQVVERRDNPGFGAACNAGMTQAQHPVTVLLNPDCELLDGSLAALASRAGAWPGALHAPRLLDGDGGVQRSAHPVPGTVGALAAAPLHAPRSACAPRADRAVPGGPRPHGRVGDRRLPGCGHGDPAPPRPVRPPARLFAEDMDLCLRARAAGMPTILHPDLRLRHHGGHATRRDGEPFDVLARRRRAVVGATRGRRAQALDDLAQALTFASRSAGHALLGGDARRPLRQLGALARARR